MTNDKICREVVYCDECNKRIKKGSTVYWYDYVMLGLDYKRTIDRRFFVRSDAQNTTSRILRL